MRFSPRNGSPRPVEHVVHRVVKRTQVGQHLLLERAGQEAERLPRLDRGTGQDDAVDLAALEQVEGIGHREVGLARSRGPDSKDDIVPVERLDIGELVAGPRRHRRFRPGAEETAFEEVRNLPASGHLPVFAVGERLDRFVHGVAEGMRGDRAPLRRASSRSAKTGRARLDPVLVALEADPGVAGRHGEPELSLEFLEQRQLVRKETVEKMRRLEFQGLVGHDGGGRVQR